MSGWSGRQAQRLGELVRAEFGMICHLCGEGIAGLDEFSTDHVVPRSLGGSNDLSNLRPAHRSCNYRRGNKSLEVFRAETTNIVASWWQTLAS